jgi:hypothetical protein
MYANNLVLFLSHVQQDLQLANVIFQMFEASTGLACNISKCQLVPICCSKEKVLAAHELFPCPVKEFPIQYLGMPLSKEKLPKATLQPLTDKMADKLPAWKGRLMHWSSRLTLIKSTLAAIPIYMAISHALLPWLIKMLTKIF